jgi:hypothetical protein
VWCFEEVGRTFAVADHLFLNTDGNYVGEMKGEISAVYILEGWYKPMETAPVKKPTLLTRMSQNMFIGLGSVRTELLRMHQLAAECNVLRIGCG